MLLFFIWWLTGSHLSDTTLHYRNIFALYELLADGSMYISFESLIMRRTVNDEWMVSLSEYYKIKSGSPSLVSTTLDSVPTEKRNKIIFSRAKKFIDFQYDSKLFKLWKLIIRININVCTKILQICQHNNKQGLTR